MVLHNNPGFHCFHLDQTEKEKRLSKMLPLLFLHMRIFLKNFFHFRNTHLLLSKVRKCIYIFVMGKENLV